MSSHIKAGITLAELALAMYPPSAKEFSNMSSHFN